jgi:hypothetical protein
MITALVILALIIVAGGFAGLALVMSMHKSDRLLEDASNSEYDDHIDVDGPVIDFFDDDDDTLI